MLHKKILNTTRIFRCRRICKSPSPSLAGNRSLAGLPHRVPTVIVNQAVLLAPGHRSPVPSQGFRPSDITIRVCSLLQWRDRAGFYRTSLLSLWNQRLFSPSSLRHLIQSIFNCKSCRQVPTDSWPLYHFQSPMSIKLEGLEPDSKNSKYILEYLDKQSF